MLFLFRAMFRVLAVDKPCSTRPNYPVKETNDLTLLHPSVLSQR